MSLNDVVIQVLQYTYTYDVKNAFFVDKDAYDNTKDGRKYKYRYHPNGKLKSKYEYYMNGPKVVRHGIAHIWYENGELAEEREYANGELIRGTDCGNVLNTT